MVWKTGALVTGANVALTTGRGTVCVGARVTGASVGGGIHLCCVVVVSGTVNRTVVIGGSGVVVVTGSILSF